MKYQALVSVKTSLRAILKLNSCPAEPGYTLPLQTM